LYLIIKGAAFVVANEVGANGLVAGRFGRLCLMFETTEECLCDTLLGSDTRVFVGLRKVEGVWEPPGARPTSVTPATDAIVALLRERRRVTDIFNPFNMLMSSWLDTPLVDSQKAWKCGSCFTQSLECRLLIQQRRRYDTFGHCPPTPREFGSHDV
jgi:hypothetical protein